MARGRKRLYGSVIVNGRNEVSNGILSLTNLILLAFFLACFFTLHLPFTRIHLFPALHRGWLELLRDFRSSISEFFLLCLFLVRWPKCENNVAIGLFLGNSDICITMEKYYFLSSSFIYQCETIFFFFNILSYRYEIF